MFQRVWAALHSLDHRRTILKMPLGQELAGPGGLWDGELLQTGEVGRINCGDENG